MIEITSGLKLWPLIGIEWKEKMGNFFRFHSLLEVSFFFDEIFKQRSSKSLESFELFQMFTFQPPPTFRLYDIGDYWDFHWSDTAKLQCHVRIVVSSIFRSYSFFANFRRKKNYTQLVCLKKVESNGTSLNALRIQTANRWEGKKTQLADEYNWSKTHTI